MLGVKVSRRKVLYAAVVGDCSRKRLEYAAKQYRIEIAALDSDMVFGKAHIESAIAHARRAIGSGTNIAKFFVIEIIRYASGERQISEALAKMCAKPGKRRAILLIVGECDVECIMKELTLRRVRCFPKGSFTKMKEFGITNKEIASVPVAKRIDLVLERVALVELEK